MSDFTWEEIDAAPRTRLNVNLKAQSASYSGGRSYDLWPGSYAAIPTDPGQALTNADAGPFQLPTPPAGKRWHLLGHDLTSEATYSLLLIDRLAQGKVVSTGANAVKPLDLPVPARWPAVDRKRAARYGAIVVQTLTANWGIGMTWEDDAGVNRSASGISTINSGSTVSTFQEMYASAGGPQSMYGVNRMTGLFSPATSGEEGVLLLYRELAWIDVQPRRHVQAPLGERESMGTTLQAIEPDSCLSAILFPNASTIRAIIGTLEFGLFDLPA